jgi:hypothetical protein
VLNTLEEACDNYDYDGIRAFLDNLLAGPDMAAQLSELRLPAEIVPIKPAEQAD